jgi:hypothetical protein
MIHQRSSRSSERRQSPIAAPIGRVCGLFAFFLWLGAPALAETLKKPTERPTVEQMVGYFDTIVFEAEIDKNMAQSVVAKWQGAIRIAVQGHSSPRHREFLAGHVETLRGLTGLSLEVLPPDGSGQNMTVVFVPRAGMNKVQIPGVKQSLIDRLAAPGGCYFVSFRKPESQIVAAVIVVNTQRKEEHINHCLLEEITQSLGLPNDSDTLRPSLFSDHDYLLAPSRVDTILIKTLYDPRMKAGLPRKEALEVARTIIAEFDRTLP